MRLSGRFVTFLLLVLGICSVIYLSIFLRGASSAPIVGKHGFVVKRNTDQQPQQDDPPLSKVASFFALSKAEVEEIANDTYARPTPWHVDARHPLCEREQVIQGQWERTELDAPPYITPTVHLRCFADEVYKQKPYISYDWKPDAVKEKLCDFTPWSVSRFCKVMHKATILIVGDSLSWEHYASLIQLLGGKTRQGYQHQSKYLNMTISQPVCNNQVRVSYRRDDRLQNLAGALLERPPKYFPEVLVLNRGAHYASDEDLLQNLRTNLGYVKTWLKQCDFYEFKCHFFWRTTVPGHPDCGSFKAPNNNLTEMEQHIANYPYDEKMTNYHWYDFQHQNQLVLEELEKSGIEYRVLDAYYLNVRRPDEHRAHQGDCLHSCYPGKMDVYSQLMLHYLRKDRTIQHVDHLEGIVHRVGWSAMAAVATPYEREAWEKARDEQTTKTSKRDLA